MMLRCRSCETRFEVAAGEKARCPNCLRTLGLEPDLPVGQAASSETSPAGGNRSRWLGGGIALGALALAGVLASVLFAPRCPGGGGEEEPGAASAILSPEETARRKGEALRLVQEAREQLQSGKLREANHKADEAFRLAPVAAEVRQLRGEIYRASGGLAEAANEFAAALAAEENADRHVLAGETLAALGEVPRAEQHLKRARALDPQARQPVVALGLLYQATQRQEELDALRKELAPDGGSSPLLEALEQGLKQYEEARARQMEALRQQLEQARQAREAAGGTGEPGQGPGDAAGAADPAGVAPDGAAPSEGAAGTSPSGPGEGPPTGGSNEVPPAAPASGPTETP